MVYVTTSWNGGSIFDLKMADVLERHGLKATFYIPKFNPLLKKAGVQHLSDSEINQLAARHEIGSGSLNHSDLSILSNDEIRYELNESRRWLQSVTNKDATMFCYPLGALPYKSDGLLRETGYIGARSGKLFEVRASEGPLYLPTTLRVCPRTVSSWSGVVELAGELSARFSAFSNSKIGLSEVFSQEKLVSSLLERAFISEGFFHLWGDSSVIEKFTLWDSLEALFVMLSETPGVTLVTNAELVHALYY